ncbi:MAG: hypothetical protein V3T86_02380 [Planctomycetota bacterium]
MDVIAGLLKLHDMDRKIDRLQKKLDQVPIWLKAHTDAITELEGKVAEEKGAVLAARAESKRNELEVDTKEAQRDKVRSLMTAPKLSMREYQTLQEQMAGLLADINSCTEQTVVTMDRAKELEEGVAAHQAELEKAKTAYDEKKVELEAPLADVRADLEKRKVEREEYVHTLNPDATSSYARVRVKHADAMSAIDGTIDRAAGRIGNDLHCSACYMAVTSNDAVKVIGGSELMRCKSCTRILYAL